MEDDPVIERRARLARLASTGKAVGYTLLLFAIGAFVSGAATKFTPLIVRLVVVAMVASSILLAPAIVLGYAVRAAERDERN